MVDWNGDIHVQLGTDTDSVALEDVITDLGYTSSITEDMVSIKQLLNKLLRDSAYFAGDTDKNGSVNLGDAAVLKAVFRKKTTLSW